MQRVWAMETFLRRFLADKTWTKMRNMRGTLAYQISINKHSASRGSKVLQTWRCKRWRSQLRRAGGLEWPFPLALLHGAAECHISVRTVVQVGIWVNEPTAVLALDSLRSNCSGGLLTWARPCCPEDLSSDWERVLLTIKRENKQCGVPIIGGIPKPPSVQTREPRKRWQHSKDRILSLLTTPGCDFQMEKKGRLCWRIIPYLVSMTYLSQHRARPSPRRASSSSAPSSSLRSFTFRSATFSDSSYFLTKVDESICLLV